RCARREGAGRPGQQRAGHLRGPAPESARHAGRGRAAGREPARRAGRSGDQARRHAGGDLPPPALPRRAHRRGPRRGGDRRRAGGCPPPGEGTMTVRLRRSELATPGSSRKMIEETAALARVEEIAASSPRLEALILGFGDLSASQGVRLALAAGYPGDLWHYARARVVVAARAHGLDAIDGPFANYRDAEGYRREATWASTLGFVGKWAIHPSQIEIANDVFAPTE